MADTNFSAAVSAWVMQTQQRAEAVFRESAQRVIAEMQKPVGAGGNMPVDTGFLRASLQISTDKPASMTAVNKGEQRHFIPKPAVLTIATVKYGQTIYASYTAEYASFVNYGTSKMQGRHFVETAAQKWPQIVAKVAGELQSRASGSTPAT